LKNQHIIVAGAGIGGLSAALALASAGQRVTVLERSAQFAPLGAGIQLGPNAMKVLAQWGLQDAVLAKACLPEAIAVHSATTGRSISRMLLGQAVQQRYGQVYACVHRADLHSVLLEAVHSEKNIDVRCAAPVQDVDLLNAGGVQVHLGHSGDTNNAEIVQSTTVGADALIAADGLWSTVRNEVFADGAHRPTGHAAYRVLLPMQAVPSAWATAQVGLWWGRKVHVVHYLVRSGDYLNLVVLSEQPAAQATASWAQPAEHAQVMDSMGGVGSVCAQLRDLLAGVPTSGAQWQSWHLYDRPATAAWVKGRVALLGDAAHPMLPYLAQGAAMAIEDAAVLAQQVAAQGNWQAALQRYETLRRPRCERVVATARRNGQIFHLGQPWAAARDAVLSLKGTQVVGLPWLYGANV
jgi:salicylate hydroxylase